MAKRPLDIVVLSDIHLGTVGCHALELLQYLNSIDPKIIVLNGDFVDVWNFRKYYWPEWEMYKFKEEDFVESERIEKMIRSHQHKSGVFIE